MRIIYFIILSWTLQLSSSVFAGALYGTVRIRATTGSLQPAINFRIAVACPGFSYSDQLASALTSAAVTDSRGSYSLLVRAKGRCQMQVSLANKVGVPFDVFVSNNPLRFDFEIDHTMSRVP